MYIDSETVPYMYQWNSINNYNSLHVVIIDLIVQLTIGLNWVTQNNGTCRTEMVPVVHPCRNWHGPSCPLWKNLMVPVVHLDITGWSQLSTYVKNGMVPVVHGTSCLAPVQYTWNEMRTWDDISKHARKQHVLHLCLNIVIFIITSNRIKWLYDRKLMKLYCIC